MGAPCSRQAAAATPPGAGAATADTASTAGTAGTAGTGWEPALLRRHPALRALPRARFVNAPTPVEPLALPGAPAGACFVKRDDRSCPLYGGNKPRKLEFLLGAALARRTRRLVTTGGIGTNHGLATTILGRSLGLATTVVCVPQPPSEHVRRQLADLLAFGAEIRFARSVPGAAARVSWALARSRAAGERPLLIPAGGSSALGDVGYVSAAFELAEQVAAGVLPAPAEIYAPLGTGGTVSGLALGLALAGLPTRVVGVLVTDILPPGARRVRALARASLARLRRLDPSLPEVRLDAGSFEITRAQLGAGYGSPTEAGRAAAAIARDAGLALETTYTAKCLAELIDRLRDGRLRAPALFWNTYNSVDYRAHAPADAARHELPAALRAWLARTEAAG
ncbi:MAG: pyridoxal-phosphate dependent enzyme [Deltaproteobacteria bacterium]|nr:pyridoxal-phosphate dependent enzyme [Deltaproteobacteria bacterium]